MMTLHRESRTVTEYELTVLKKGPKLRAYMENAPALADGQVVHDRERWLRENSAWSSARGIRRRFTFSAAERPFQS